MGGATAYVAYKTPHGSTPFIIRVSDVGAYRRQAYCEDSELRRGKLNCGRKVTKRYRQLQHQQVEMAFVTSCEDRVIALGEPPIYYPDHGTNKSYSQINV